MTEAEEYRQRDLRHAKLPLKAVMNASGKALRDELTIILSRESLMSPFMLVTHQELLDIKQAATRCAQAAQTLLESARDL